jgi:hypothetical protein
LVHHRTSRFLAEEENQEVTTLEKTWGVWIME